MSSYNSDIHHRRSIRLKGYDYSQAGLYFVTICVNNHQYLFGEIVDGEMTLNGAGKMVVNQWSEIKNRFKNTVLHEYIVMPNHFHAIIELVGAIPCGCPVLHSEMMVDKRAETSPAPTIGDVICAFKSLTTREYMCHVRENNWQSFDKKLWQRNYHEHIIRNEIAYLKISEYIQTNPQKWLEDCYFETQI